MAQRAVTPDRNDATMTTSNGAASYDEQRNNAEFICPICFDVIKDASVTRCGHTYCCHCILKSIARFKRCPKCNAPVDSVFPNFLLDELIARYKLKQRLEDAAAGRSNLDGLKAILTTESQKLSLPDINQMLRVLNERKQLLEAESSAVQNCLLYEFLKQLLKLKEEHYQQVGKDIEILKRDLQLTEIMLKSLPPTQTQSLEAAESSSAAEASPFREEAFSSSDKGLEVVSNTSRKRNFISSRKRMYSHFDDFASLYFTSRRKEVLTQQQQSTSPASSETKMDVDHNVKAPIIQTQSLEDFRENLVKFSRFSGFKSMATLRYSSDMISNSTIVSTIEFDKDNEYFAIGGVTKRIKLYDYYTVVNDTVDIHYPCAEMTSNSKISCISWNSQYKSTLASSDYEGYVSIWDANTAKLVKSFHEHEKRCWSVDFNEVDPNLIVSGSDDLKLKLWSLNDAHSIATLEAKANVCCVKFNPTCSRHFAFGSANHDVCYYDLRNLTKPIATFRGHRKAVSYVKFLNSNELVSASTDSQLKLWDVKTFAPQTLRTFTGHVNEKNFIGLAADREYIACGSEDNAVYMYYKGLSKNILSYKFDHPSEATDFVSAVCYRKQYNVVLAANSRGVIKILELV